MSKSLLIIFVSFTLFCLLYYLRRAFSIYVKGEHPKTGSPPIIRFIMGSSLLIIGVFGFFFPDQPAWLRFLGSPCMIYSQLFGYFANKWVLGAEIAQVTQETKVLERNKEGITKTKIFWFITLSLLINAVIGLMRGDNTGSFIHNEAFIPSIIYYIYTLVGFALSLYLAILTTVVFWKHIRQYKEPAHIIRRSSGLTALLIIVFCNILVIFNIFSFAAFQDETLRYKLNSVLFTALPVVGPLFTINILPSRFFQFLAKPLKKHQRKRLQKFEQAKLYLLPIYMNIAPEAQNLIELPQEYQSEAKLDLARYIMWTFEPRVQPISAEEEARYVFHQYTSHIIRSGMGMCDVQPPQLDPDQHYLEVFKHIKVLEKQNKILLHQNMSSNDVSHEQHEVIL